MASSEPACPTGSVFTPQPEPPAPTGEQRPPRRRGLGALAALGVVLLKFATKLKALLLLLPKRNQMRAVVVSVETFSALQDGGSAPAQQLAAA